MLELIVSLTSIFASNHDRTRVVRRDLCNPALKRQALAEHAGVAASRRCYVKTD